MIYVWATVLPSCPKCGANTEQIGATGKGICPKCGIVEFTPASTQIDLNQSKFCQYCGKELTVNFDFCPNCGKPLTLEAKGSTLLRQTETASNPSVAWYFVPIFLTLLGSIIGYFALKDRDRRMARNVAVVGVVMPFVWISIIVISASLQTTPLQKPQIVTTTLPQKTTETLGEISDLAYIQTYVSGYTDDADPESDGMSIVIIFFDGRSEIIQFRNIPFLVHVKVLGYRDFQDFYDYRNGEIVYDKTFKIDHSATLKEMFGSSIRVPFESMSVDRNQHYQTGWIEIVVVTSQGNFSSPRSPVSLYETK